MTVSAVDSHDWADQVEEGDIFLLLSSAMVFVTDKLSCYQCCTVLWNALCTLQTQICT